MGLPVSSQEERKMEDLLIIGVLIVILIPAVKSTITHLKGEGSCCGGPKEKVPKDFDWKAQKGVSGRD